MVSKTNPRYFTVASGDGREQEAILSDRNRTSNNNFYDGRLGPDCAGEPEPLDFDAYLTFLDDHGHNFIRLWRWKHFQLQATGGRFPPVYVPTAVAGHRFWRSEGWKPKFDLSQFDMAFFDRLRNCIIAAGIKAFTSM